MEWRPMTNSSVRALMTSSGAQGRERSLRAARALSRMTAFRLGAKGCLAGVVFIVRAGFVSLLAASTHTASIMLRKCSYSS
eukprot:5424862-Lingulodinium_polyedra.AAC.1